MTKRLWTTREVAEELCSRKNISTDYGLAKALGIDTTTATGWRKGHRIMSDDHAATVAPMIDEDPAWLALCLAVERVKSANLSDRMREILLAAANRAAVVALGLGVVVGGVIGHIGTA
jgi:hypothetical protein